MKNKHVVTSFSYPADKDAVIDEAEKIALREGKTKSQLIVKLLEEYVNQHGSGNPSFEITKWVDQSDYKITPAFMADVKQWQEYIEKKCNSEEITEIQRRAQWLNSVTSKEYWVKRKEEKYGNNG